MTFPINLRGKSRRGGGVAPPPAAGMVAWWKKNTQVGAGFCSSWPDASGSGNPLAQATGANQPTLPGDGSLLCDGAAHFMKIVATTLNQPATVYWRLKQITWTDFDAICDGDTGNSFTLLQRTASPGLALSIGGAFVTPVVNLALNTYGTVSYGRKTNGTDCFIQVDSGAEQVVASAGVALGGYTLGARADGPQRFANVQYLEGILYNVAHTPAQRAAIIAYMATV